MLKVTITSTAIREMKGVGKTSGKPYHMAFQTGWVHTFERDGNPMPFPEKIELNLDRNEAGDFQLYQPGEYQLHPSSLYVDHNGGLSVAPRLVAVRKG
ncbi:G5P family DNA-binding protein [Hydrogenophaga sp. NFH-34]|uniref:G5P family DNA-binding protein n=1 Tax=Hydrogenophaga sp. NFH-34 TaxID=2744446 RepID=UPI001F39F82C|nr:G5P family DNA-binding protein [Hydrogenophaga sp. NFH-34]